MNHTYLQDSLDNLYVTPYKVFHNTNRISVVFSIHTHTHTETINMMQYKTWQQTLFMHLFS